MLKKLLSTTLAVCVLTSVFAVSVSANAGDPVRRPLITDVVTSDIDTNTYYFYMPEEWRNIYNDSYDGNSLDSCTAGIYWWDGECKPDDNHDGLESAWPGYVIKETLPEDKNIFAAGVPKKVTTIIFNNTVDNSGERKNDINLAESAKQTINIVSDNYNADDDNYGFYPEGVKSFDKMIFVCAPPDNTLSEYNPSAPYKGEWFYYYGSGKYGYYKTLSEAEAKNAVYSGGSFPDVPKNDTEDISEWNVSGIENKIYTGKALKQNKITVSKNGENAEFSVNYKDNINAGTATVTITGMGKYTGTIVKTFKINKTSNPIKVTAKKTVTAKAEKKTTIKKAVVVNKAQGTVTYKTNNKKVTVKNGTMTVAKGLKKGKTYKIKVTITAKGNGNYNSKKIVKTIKIKVK